MLRKLAFLAAFVAAIAAAGTAEAHDGGYLHVVVDVTDYQRTPYVGHDLIQVDLTVENVWFFNMTRMGFVLGDGDSIYGESSYGVVRARGGDLQEGDCPNDTLWSSLKLAPGETGRTQLCFMVDPSFEPDGILVFDWSTHAQMSGDGQGIYFFCEHQVTHDAPPDEFGHLCPAQVIPFDDESGYCGKYPDICNVNNVQRIDGGPEPVSLVHALYLNSTGTLMMVFDGPVVASNPSRIGLVHDLDAFFENGTAADLGDAELRTLDGQRRSTVLAFGLPDELRQAVVSPDDLVLVVNPRAIYASEGFADFTRSNGYDPVLVSDVAVVR